MIIDVNNSLNQFILDRPEKFNTIPLKQKTKWIKNIEDNIKGQLEDNDIFYDQMPEDVEELD